MNTFIYMLRKFLNTISSRGFAAGMLAIIMAFSVFKLSVMTKAVYINDGKETTLKFTTQQDAKDILVDEGIRTHAFDVVDASGFSGKVAYINIKRAFPVNIEVDGKTISLMKTEGTVADAIAEGQIEVGENDIINLSLDKPLVADENIVITRINQEQFTVSEIIEHEVIYKPTSLIKPGKTKTLEQGWDGEKILTYEQTKVDGENLEDTLVSEEIVKSPKTTVILQGVASAPISQLNLGYTLDSNGIPTSYKSVLTNQVATGYSASKKARGASGMKLSYGYVATDPKDIPYGTEMYITSEDGSFVYGYAIAADTGTGLLEGIIDVDLYYETYLESCLNSRRNVNIYILD
ncbi:MAG: ubiquitin-like domain-containing protein [Oscillospiraceae bacterium]